LPVWGSRLKAANGYGKLLNLTWQQRCQLLVPWADGMTRAAIATLVGTSQTTVSGE
jgi:hypothetical protein